MEVTSLGKMYYCLLGLPGEELATSKSTFDVAPAPCDKMLFRKALTSWIFNPLSSQLDRQVQPPKPAEYLHGL